MTERLARSCSRHPWRAIGGWIVAVVLAVAALALLLGDLTTEGHPTNNPESQRAEAMLERGFPPDPSRGASDLVVVSSPRYTVDEPQYRAFISRLVAAGRATGGVVNARVYYVTHDKTQVSSDRHAMLIPIVIPDTDDAGAVEEVALRADRDAAFAVAVTGDQTIDNDFNELSQHDLKSGELQFGIPAALIILILVFGAIVAGLVPLLMAIISIVVALGLVAVLSQPFNLSVFIFNMLTGMGLALGIDYSLFVVSRYREERAVGREQFDAIGGAGATASRAVLVSGTAFVVAMCGMLIVPNNVMRSLALGAILVGVVSVVAALTLLPALLGLLGDRINRLRIPFVGRASLERSNPEGRFWRAIVERVLGRPAFSLIVATALLLALAVPVLGLKVGSNGVSTLPGPVRVEAGLRRAPAGLSARDDRSGLGGRRPRVRSAATSALGRLRSELATDRRFAGRGDVLRSKDGQLNVLQVVVRGDSPGPAQSRRCASSAATSFRAGSTAPTRSCWSAGTQPRRSTTSTGVGPRALRLSARARPDVRAADRGLPLGGHRRHGLLLNLLSVGAAYGLLVLVFQHGIGAGLLGFSQADTIEAWVPLFLFSVLFGLSMDYQVFLLSRIRERYDASDDTSDAVAHGVAATARIITGAALIIVAVFLGFAMGDLIMFQQMGFGVAIALLIDATVIRSVILPSAMKLLGRWNWYLPRWLEWLPRLDAEGPQPTSPAQAVS